MRAEFRAGAWVLVLALTLAAAGCQKQAAGPKVDDYQKQRQAIIEKHKQQSAGFAVAQPGAAGPAQGEHDATSYGAVAGSYVYDPVGKRDPFRSFILDRVAEKEDGAKGPLEQFDLAQLDVTGVVWEAEKKRALVIDPSGRAYIVKVGDAIGKNDGVILGIGDNVVLVREAYVDFHGEKTTKEIEMRVRQSQGG